MISTRKTMKSKMVINRDGRLMPMQLLPSVEGYESFICKEDCACRLS